MRHNILLVDDSQTVKAVIAKALVMSGLDMGTLFKAGNGREGLEILRREKVDLVFADINMPVMGGIQMVQEMKADETLKRIPVVVISTEGSVQRIQALEDMGISAFLRKPFQPEALKKVVDGVLGGNHA